jgi:hypothetical protein
MTMIPNRPTRRRLLKAAAGAGLGLVAAPYLLRAACLSSETKCNTPRFDIGRLIKTLASVAMR